MTTKAESILGGYVAGAVETGLQFQCFRCGETLTDPASVEAGIGPICRKLENAAYAVTIPAHIPGVLHLLSTVTFKAEPLTLALAAVVEEIHEGAAKDRKDWRGVAHILTRLIAYSNASAKDQLCSAIDALGYTTLAAVAREEASPSVAEITLANGRLVLKTKRVKAAIEAIKAIPGRKFHTDTKTWSFPLEACRAVVEVVGKFFPMTKLNVLALATEVSKAMEAAAKPAVAAPVAQPAPKPEPKVQIMTAPNGFNIASPYNAAFVADLKTSVPYKMRSWNPDAKCWWVAKEMIDTAKSLVVKHYGNTALAA